MKTVRFDEYYDPDLLLYEDIRVPVLGPREVRVRVAATAFVDDFRWQRGLNALATRHRTRHGV